MCRRSVTDKIQGGVSALIKVLLHTFFDRDRHDISTAGILLTLHDGSEVRLFVTFGLLLADEAALHSAYQCKGSSGLKPCALCQNIFDGKSVRGIVERDTRDWARYHTCCNPKEFVLHTPESITAILTKLAGAIHTMSATKFGELTTRLGFNFVENSLLLDPVMRSLVDPSEHLMYDWMHVYYVNGVFNTHVGQMMVALKPHGITYDTLHTYLSNWHWPSGVGTLTGRETCCSKRAKSSMESGSFKCTASEGLSLYPVFAHFVQQSVMRSSSDDAKAHGQSFLDLTTFLELVSSCARGVVTPEQLEKAVVQHVSSFKALYGVGPMIIKFHYSLHFPLFLHRWGYLPSCFTLERKHRVPKRYANQISNTSHTWEEGVLRELTGHHIFELRSTPDRFSITASLVDGKVPSKRMHGLLTDIFQPAPGDALQTSRVARIDQWEKCRVGDMVTVREEGGDVVGQVRWHAAVVGEAGVTTFTCVSRSTLISRGPRSTTWQRSEEMSVHMTSELRYTLTWSESRGVITALMRNTIAQ